MAAHEWTDMERLIVAQAVYKVVADEVSTKDPDGLRGRMDAEARAAYERDGIKSRDALLLGEKVGTWSVKVSKAVEETREDHVVVEDARAMDEWLLGNALTMAAYIQRDGVLEDFANWVLGSTGEVPGGCSVTEVVHHGRPAGFAGTTLKVDPARVAEVMQGQLPAAVAGLLGGEAE